MPQPQSVGAAVREAREYWIYFYDYNDNLNKSAKVSDVYEKDWFHVIEHSAYLALEREREYHHDFGVRMMNERNALAVQLATTHSENVSLKSQIDDMKAQLAELTASPLAEQLFKMQREAERYRGALEQIATNSSVGICHDGSSEYMARKALEAKDEK